nr:MAG TPA: helix-turn-helix domain protein [Caudoviricetes sp.]
MVRRARFNAGGLTQEEFGDMLGVSTTAVNNWETGRCKPQTRYQAEILAIYLDCRDRC